jgi:hypothetical protein
MGRRCSTSTYSCKQIDLEVQVSVCAIKHITMKASAGVEVQFHSFLILAVDRGQW